jgi:hypothetical protein
MHTVYLEDREFSGSVTTALVSTMDLEGAGFASSCNFNAGLKEQRKSEFLVHGGDANRISLECDSNCCSKFVGYKFASNESLIAIRI